ncbi:MAG: phosphomethylpyrimidine synthase ThiC [Candidatus Omnitrophota bacterium]
MTLLEKARKRKITPEIRAVAKLENLSPEFVLDCVATGKVVIPQNKQKKIKKPCGIGQGLRTKINANIGTSPEYKNLDRELDKLKIAVCYGADTVMDLSTGGDTLRILSKILAHSPVPVGTVPIYQSAVAMKQKKKKIIDMTAEDMIAAVETHAKMGVDFMTIHCGVIQETVARLKAEGRILDIVSRGGSFLLEWMVHNKKENPFYRYFDKILQIASRYDMVLSLGDGLRPGAIIDSTDRAQIQELIILGEQAKKAQERGIQVIIEGPGHLPLSDIEANVLLAKKICHDAPFYVLGPLVTDVALGYDHICGAIGGAIAAMHGADFLCYVTPSEHLHLPDADDVKEGVIASRIAAHAADIAKNVPGAKDWDLKISLARRKRDWKTQIKLSLDKQRAKKYHNKSSASHTDVCTMCGEYCSIKIAEKNLRG